MTTTELTRHIKLSTGKSFLSFSEIVELGFGKDTVRSLVRDLDYVTTGNERRNKKYFVGDVSRAIMDRRMLHD